MKAFRINSHMRSHVSDLECKDACKITLRLNIHSDRNINEADLNIPRASE